LLGRGSKAAKLTGYPERDSSFICDRKGWGRHETH
jgi:hypothetical protein